MYNFAGGEQWLFNYLRSSLPTDHAKESSAERIVIEAMSTRSAKRMVDLGCGTGKVMPFLQKNFPKLDYHGIDIKLYPQTKSLANKHVTFAVYDGEKLPLVDDEEDLIFCKQVLEHVTNPFTVLSEVKRVLSKNGVFAGSVSQFEPYHSQSVLNYTCYGLKYYFERFGLNLILLRPSIDVFSLVDWYKMPNEKERLVSRWPDVAPCDCETPVNYEIDVLAKRNGWSVQETNFEKLKYSGQLCFAAIKGS